MYRPFSWPRGAVFSWALAQIPPPIEPNRTKIAAALIDLRIDVLL
jgi:hypothetical protein